jgi:hypothetical protein
MHASSNALVVGAPAAKEKHNQSQLRRPVQPFVPSNPRIIIHYSTYSVPLWVF